TKWAWEVKTAAEIPAALARAFTISQTPPTGPVFLSLPVNLMEERAEMEFHAITRIAPRLRGDRESIAAAARLLATAKNPAIIAGDACARSGALGELAKLAETVAARVHTEPLSALLDFPTGHPLFAGPLFPNAKQTQAQLEGADVILIIGVNNLSPLVYTGTRMIPAGARLIQVNADPRELGKNFPAEVAILADPRAAIEDLLEAFTSFIGAEASESLTRRRELLAAKIAETRAKFIGQLSFESDSGLLPPALVAREMRAAAAPDAVIVDECVTSSVYIRTLFELNGPGSYLFAKGGSLGLGLPAGVGMKMGMPERQVICAVGDGSALYSIQALWTAARYRVGVKFVIFNNTSYAILKGGLLAYQGASVARGVFPGMDITEPEINFVQMSESMGVPARRVAAVEELRPALDWAFSYDGPTLLDVAIARDVRSVLR
ncbi:MAG TPA: thiamine pyrophosphate-dependent enzyme, partial [Blastocatellia bacterium]|nr:thiamine pyrophosphate-dependent enzyme [Blastocatellia bacterium]